MKTRIIQTRFWNDDVVHGVGKDARYLWIFLLTNRELGMTNYFQLPDVMICYLLGCTPGELKKAKEELELTKKVFFYNEWIFIVNLEKENKYKNSPKNLPTYEEELSHVPQRIKDYFDNVLNESDTSIGTSTISTTDTNPKSKIINNKSKIKNDEIDFKNKYKEFIRIFNEITGKKFEPTDKLFHNFKARYDTYKGKKMVEAVQNANNDTFLTGDNPGKKWYLTPEYILREDKMERWLNCE